MRTLCFLLLSLSFLGVAHSAEPKLKSLANSLGMKLNLVPAGEFMMGCSEPKENLFKAFPDYEEPKRVDGMQDEYPAHKVRITKPFYVGIHEVTIGQFKQFMEKSGYKTNAETDGKGGWGYNPATGEFEGRKLEYTWKTPGFTQADSHPVINVTYHDAVAFCEWLSKQENRRYRLPTEAEWEYACRAGTTTRFHSGDDPESLTKVAAIYDSKTREVFPQWTKFAMKSSDGFAFTAPVGSFAANAFGLHDMHGNVWEWCSDWHDDNYYKHSPVDDPQGPKEGRVKVRRGGSWHTWAFYCRSSFRNWNTQSTRYVLMGFRVVAEE